MEKSICDGLFIIKIFNDTFNNRNFNGISNGIIQFTDDSTN